VTFSLNPARDAVRLEAKPDAIYVSRARLLRAEPVFVDERGADDRTAIGRALVFRRALDGKGAEWIVRLEAPRFSSLSLHLAPLLTRRMPDVIRGKTKGVYIVGMREVAEEAAGLMAGHARRL
jgi:hypothetical protein